MPGAPDIGELIVHWAAAMKHLIDTLKHEPNSKEDNRYLRSDIIKWCTKVIKANDDADAIGDAMLKQAYQPPTNINIQSEVSRVAARLARLEREDMERATSSRGAAMIEKSLYTQEEWDVGSSGETDITDEAEDNKMGSEGDIGQHEQDVEEDEKTIAREPEKLFDSCGVETAVVRDGVAYYHKPCKICKIRGNAICKGRPYVVCDACRKCHATCDYATRRKTFYNESQHEIKRKLEAHGLTAIRVQDSEGEGMSARWLRLEYVLRSGYATVEDQGAENEDVLTVELAPKSAPRASRTDGLAGAKAARNQPTERRDSVSELAPDREMKIRDGRNRYHPFETRSEAAEGILSEVRVLREELDAAKAALKRECDRVSEQQDRSAMLQKQVTNLILEVRSLQRIIQRLEGNQ